MTGSDNSIQTQRTERLEAMVLDWHRHGAGDYEDTFDEFRATYLGFKAGDEEPSDILPEKEIPEWAAIVGDETYSLISLHETKREAIIAVGRNIGESTLNNPIGVYNMDTGESVAIVTVTLSAESAAALGGLVARNEGHDVLEDGEATHKNGIFCDWVELRAAFPLETFKEWAQDEDNYDPEFGF